MKAVILISSLALLASTAAAQVYVQPYITKDGIYIEGHQRTAPNSTKADNYGSQGNVNPYTGQTGRIDPYAHPPQYNQQQLAPTPGLQQCSINKLGQYVCR